MQVNNRTLFFGDNLRILEKIPNEQFDLIYLDPPFNSDRNYYVLFKEGQGDSSAQIHAFEDTWEWTPQTIRLFEDLQNSRNPKIVILINSLAEFIGQNPMLAYLVNMTARLLELYRVLKQTGSLWLHCDPTASHYLKVILDTIFDSQNYRNEIIWHYGQRTAFHKSHFSRKHDIIFFYAKSNKTILHPVAATWTREEFLAHRHDVKVDEDGREFIWTDGGKPGIRYKRYVEEVLKEGKPLDTVWD